MPGPSGAALLDGHRVIALDQRGRDLERRADGLWPHFDADVMEAAIRPVTDASRWDAWVTILRGWVDGRGGKGL